MNHRTASPEAFRQGTAHPKPQHRPLTMAEWDARKPAPTLLQRMFRSRTK